jgi:hypothetical protein
MKESEVGKLLTFASGFDRRQVDAGTVYAWRRVLNALGDIPYQDAEDAIVAHHTGPNKHVYLNVGHIVDALKVGGRKNLDQIEGDVRSAKARGLIGVDWSVRDALPAEVAAKLAGARERERSQAQGIIEAAEYVPNPQPLGDLTNGVGRRPPRGES